MLKTIGNVLSLVTIVLLILLSNKMQNLRRELEAAKQEIADSHKDAENLRAVIRYHNKICHPDNPNQDDLGAYNPK